MLLREHLRDGLAVGLVVEGALLLSVRRFLAWKEMKGMLRRATVDS